jgi:kynureninase
MKYTNSLAFAREQDKRDSLKKFRSKFYFPKHGGRDALYFCGNSLGLQPRTVAANITTELEDWSRFASEAHFKAHTPWYSYHEVFAKPLSKLCGALPQEVIAMNQLTVNLHLLLITFYRPTAGRYKIICEASAFPSDQYALQTQMNLHGIDPDKALVEVTPRKGEHLLRTEDILKAIDEHAGSLALVLFGGINYLTGQLFDMPSITRAAHKAGALAGFDLAHAMGNAELKLHDWQADFAVWCSYKYLNSGPGGVAGAFIHSKHTANLRLPRLGGWWGYDKKTRFLMKKKFIPMPTAEGWQLSNAPVLSMAAHKASLDIFMQAGGMSPLRKKSRALTAYLESLLMEINSSGYKTKLEIITPANPDERGCQLSVIAHGAGRELYDKITRSGVYCDWREPNVIRFAPAPLYNSFTDVWKLGQAIQKCVR